MDNQDKTRSKDMYQQNGSSPGPSKNQVEVTKPANYSLVIQKLHDIEKSMAKLTADVNWLKLGYKLAAGAILSLLSSILISQLL